MPDKRIATPQDALTYAIIGAAMAVHRARGPGYREDTYQRDLGAEFARRGLSWEEQLLLPVYDPIAQEALVGYYIPDFVVDGQVIVEIKALGGLDAAHVAQVIGYLAVTGCALGLLLNFGTRSLHYRRILPPTHFLPAHLNRQWLFVPDWLRRERAERTELSPDLATD